MKNSTRTSLVLFASLVLSACGGEEAATPTPAAPATAPSPTGAEVAPAAAVVAPAAAAADPARAPFVGHWHHSEMPTVLLTVNDSGRVRLAMDGAPCVGNYVVADGQMTFTYDPGQPGCTDLGVGGRVSEDGQSLRFGIFATYVRDDQVSEAL